MWLAGIAVFLYILFVAPFALVRHDRFRGWALGKGVDSRILPPDWFLRIDHVDRFDPRGLRMRGIRLEHRTPEGFVTWAELSALAVDLRPAPLLQRRILAPRVQLDTLVIHIDESPPVFVRAGAGKADGASGGDSRRSRRSGSTVSPSIVWISETRRGRSRALGS